ncbi:hypothetical protein Tco_0832269, partial [Tanacetum coccineum]
MEDPNITMEEYIRLEEEKARRHDKVYKWKTATYGRVWYDDDVHDLRSVKSEFSALVFNDKLTSKVAFSCETTVSSLDDNNIDFRISFDESDDEDYTVMFEFADMALPPRDQRHQYLRFEGLEYTNADIADFKERFGEAVLDLDIAGALQFQLGGVRHRMSWREFILGMGLHIAEEIESAGFGAYWAESVRQIPENEDLGAYWVGISSAEDFLGITPSYTLIRDPMLMMCHRLIACSIAERSQAPEKVTVTDLFYLRGMDVGSVNILYLLARYLRMFVSRRKRGSMISRGQFVARMAEHFGLLTEQRLQGLTVIARDLPVINMAELLDAAAGALEVDEGAPDIDEGAQVVPTPVQAPQPSPVAGPARSLPQRVARLEDE